MAPSSNDPARTREDAPSAPSGQAADKRRAVLIAAAALAVLTVLALGSWWITVTLSGAGPAGSQSQELTDLSARLDAVEAAIQPIAVAFTSEPASGAIDVEAYRVRIAAARKVVDEINGMDVGGADALEVRDLIVTGGSEVLAGLDLALDAAASDEASATAPAALQVEEGLQTLKEARDLLDTLRGRASLTLVPYAIGITGEAA